MDALPPYEVRRRRSLERILRLRGLLQHPEKIAAGYGVEHVHEAIARERALMLKLREMRRTGTYPLDN